MTFECLWSAVFNCIEKKGNFSMPWRISRTVWFPCKNISPIIGLDNFSVTMNISWNTRSSTSNFISTVFFGVSRSPFATNIWKDGAGPFLTLDWGASSRIFLKSASGIALECVPVSIRPSNVSSPTSIGKYNIRLLILSPRLVERGTYDGFPCFSTRMCRKAVSSRRLLTPLKSPWRWDSFLFSRIASEFGCQSSIRARENLVSSIWGSSLSSVGG